ncbi:MAG: hypothetical protein K9G62_08550, partial [Alphaproteobacteria bacterium]|nr:hypothetical protein [Alphaproteobacteria bacterium]
MSSTKDEKPTSGDKPTLSLGGAKTLSLKPTAGGKLRQNMAQGRSGPSVPVEVRRSRRTGSIQADQGSTQDDPALTSEERETRASALRRAMEGGTTSQRRSSLPNIHELNLREKELSPKTATDPDPLRTREMEELQRIEQEERQKN